MNNYNSITNFFFELGQAKYVKNAGWQLLNAESSSFLAEHSYRSAIIAYLLAEMEGMEKPCKCGLAALFQTMHKIRLGDRHKVSANYLDYPKEIKLKIKNDQLKTLGKDLKGKVEGTIELSDEEKVIVMDAGQLAYALEAKEYQDKGYAKAQVWLDRIGDVLQTDSAKNIFKEILKTHSCEWWGKLKKKPRTKVESYIKKL